MRKVQGAGPRPAELQDVAAVGPSQAAPRADPEASRDLGQEAALGMSAPRLEASQGAARVRVPNGVLAVRAGTQDLVPRKMIGTVALEGGGPP